MLLPSQHRELTETYKQLYHGEVDDITDVMIEEVVEELVEECVEFGYDLDEAADAVEEAAILYIDEATVTYGSDTESPEQRSARAKDRLGDRKASARKAAVKGAVERVKSTARGVKAAVGIAGSIAKDEARRAGRTASHAVQKKKAEVKQGIKGLIGKGLRKAAGVAGSVAQKARKAGAAAGRAAERLGESVDVFDYILEHLVAEGYADTNENALVIMTNMSEEWREEIIDEARRADREGHERGTAANPNRNEIPHSNPAQQTMLHSKLKSRADQMGRERRNSPPYKQGGRPPLSKKEKAFLQAKDRTSPGRGHVRNPNVPDTGSHAEWPSQRRAQKDPKQNPKHNANKG
jgi:predicted RNase H-like HicB family nuclease